MTQPVLFEVCGPIAVLRINNAPVNALSQAVRQGIHDALCKAEDMPQVQALLLIGEGRTFVAGADIKEFGKPLLEPSLPALCNRLEASRLVVVAAMHGVSLGGGLEVALSCHYRIGVPDARVGLPEVHLGLIPGAGGTQRLPRLTGADVAIEAITSGRHIGAAEALNLGILDRVTQGTPLDIGLAFVRELLAQDAGPRPVGAMPRPKPLAWEAVLEQVRRRARGQLSPEVAVRAVQASTELSFDEGLTAERQLFSELMDTDQRKGLIHAFFAERQTSKLPELREVSPRPLHSIGVVGGGTMGSGIAAAALMAGLRVTLIEQDQDRLQTARRQVEDILHAAEARGKMTASAREGALADLFAPDVDDAALADADLVVEAVFEDMAAKKSVFARLNTVCKPGAVLATNTSYLDIAEIAGATGRPGDVLGLHFFSPAHVMKLLEVVVAEGTAPEAAATGFALAKKLGKTAVRAGVCDGFIGNRLMNAYRTAADHMVLDGASPFEVDAAIEAFGFAMGPFRVADLAGLDIGWAARQRRAPTLDPRARVGRYADVLCEQGHFGQKTGCGYYVYLEGARRGEPNGQVLSLIDAERAQRGITPRVFSTEDIQLRFVAAIVNEGARILQEGIARRPLDLDIAMILGYGFPRFRGGPMKWADLMGLEKLLALIEDFAKEDAFFWDVAPLLRDLVVRGACFDDLNA
ncbi:MAG: 3-hydroxyacyl-CoA dehydrogenase NAD-binding domain-containing protein [Roseobacter sp.]